MSKIDKLKEKVRLITEIIDDDDKLLIGGTIPDILADLEEMRPYELYYLKLKEMREHQENWIPTEEEIGHSYELEQELTEIDTKIQQIRSKT